MLPADQVGPPPRLAPGFAETEAAFDAVLPRIEVALVDAVTSGATDQHQQQQVVRRVIGRFVDERFRRRPLIVPVVLSA